jgi:WD40 repeat protein
MLTKRQKITGITITLAVLLLASAFLIPGLFQQPIENGSGNESSRTPGSQILQNESTGSVQLARPLWHYNFNDNQHQQLFMVNNFNRNGVRQWDAYSLNQTGGFSKVVPVVSINNDGSVIAAGVYIPELQAGIMGIGVSGDGNYTGIVSYRGGNEYFTANGSPAWGTAGDAYDAHGDTHGQNVAVSDDGSSFSVGLGPSRNTILYYNLTAARQKDLPFVEHDFHHAYRTYQHEAWSFTTYNSIRDSGLKPVVSDPHDPAGVHVAISADGQNVAAVSEDSRVYYFNQSGSLLWSNITGRSLENVAMSADGQYVAAASRDHNVYYFNATGSRLWNFTTGNVVKSVAISNNGQFITAGSDDSSVYFFEWNGSLLWNYRSGGPVESVSMSRDGQTIAAGSDDHSLYCFNQSGTLLWKYSTGGMVKSIAVSGDGKYVVAGSGDGNVYFFSRDGTDNRSKEFESRAPETC